MDTVHIDLQEGFANDRVSITIDGRVVFDEVVTTHLMHGYAASFETPVPPGPVNVEVRVPSRNLSDTITIPEPGRIYLGLGIRGGRLEHRLSDKPFAYM